MTAILSRITIDSGTNPCYSIIWLHGLGADGGDFAPMVEELALPCPVRYLFPHAPERAVTINGGYVMRAWYDISGNDISAKQDEKGIRDSQRAIEAIIETEAARGIPCDHIFLIGFSQGGAIALHTGLRSKIPLGGIVVLSAYLPLADLAAAEAGSASRNTPIFMAHGRGDTIVPCTLGIASREKLRSLGYRVDWHDYAMQHSVCDQELRDIEAWLTLRIKSNLTK